jgi:hypothetical protein
MQPSKIQLSTNWTAEGHDVHRTRYSIGHGYHLQSVTPTMDKRIPHSKHEPGDAIQYWIRGLHVRDTKMVFYTCTTSRYQPTGCHRSRRRTKKSVQNGANTSADTTNQSSRFFTRIVGRERARLGLTNTGIGAHQKGGYTVFRGQEWWTACIESRVQEIRNRHDICAVHTESTSGQPDLSNEEIIFRGIDIHKAMDLGHIPDAAVRGESCGSTANQCTKELKQVGQQNVLIGTAV